MSMTMDGNEDTQTRLEPHVMYEHMCIYRRCAACSELRGVRVSVHCGVHAIGHSALKVVEVVREDVRSVP